MSEVREFERREVAAATGRARRQSALTGAEAWGTPRWFFEELDAEFGFTLDVCALPENTKCSRFYTPSEDGLQQPWEGVCWMNPPYSRGIGKWVEKAYESSLRGAVVVCLLPVRSDTAWWHRWVMQAREIRFLRGRITFTIPAGFRTERPSNCPFASAVVIFKLKANG